jgi:hypothetical protein
MQEKIVLTWCLLIDFSLQGEALTFLQISDVTRHPVTRAYFPDIQAFTVQPLSETNAITKQYHFPGFVESIIMHSDNDNIAC